MFDMLIVAVDPREDLRCIAFTKQIPTAMIQRGS